MTPFGRLRACHRRGLAALALCAAGAAAAAGSVLERVEVTRNAERYLLEGEVVIRAPRASVYAVITDFEHLAELDDGIAESRVVERLDDRTTLVYTRLNGCVIVFCREVERLERVERVSDSEIVAHSIPDDSGDIAYSSSRWLLSTEGDTTRVVYATEIDPAFWIPPLIGTAVVRKVLRDRVRATLGNLEQAALARSAAQSAVGDDGAQEAAQGAP